MDHQLIKTKLAKKSIQQTPSNPRSSIKYLLPLMIILIAASLGSNYWLMKHIANKTKKISLRQDHLNSELKNLKDKNYLLQDKLAFFQGKYQQLKSTDLDNHWHRLSVIYLIKMSDCSLRITEDPKLASAFLTEAYRITEGIESLAMARKTIADDLIKLENFQNNPQNNRHNIDAIIKKIDLINNKLTTVPWIASASYLSNLAIQESNNPNSEPTKTTSIKSAWHNFYHRHLDSLKELIVIHRNNSPFPLSGEQVNNMQLYLSTLLTRASLAALQQRQELFTSSLKMVANNLEKYLPPSQIKHEILFLLSELSEIMLPLPLPTLKESLVTADALELALSTNKSPSHD